MTTRDWDPNEWQAYCQELMLLHYGVRVQVIPDRANGDGGLEAFVSDEGIAFQCYAPESPFSVAQQTEAQKEKIRSDTKKLIDHPARTIGLIGAGVQIRQWVLLTPAFEDKALITYSNTRSAHVLSSASEQGWCAPDFRISVHDDTLFAMARAQLFGARTQLLPSSGEDADLESLRESGQITASIEDTLHGKLSADPRIAARPNLLESYKSETLIDYFQGQTEMARLLRDFPSIHVAANSCRDLVFAGLSRSLAESDQRPLIVVKGIREQLEALLRARVPGAEEELIVKIARFFIASWWIQCPLQFESASHD